MLLLPSILRRPVIYALFKCLLQPLRTISERYDEYISKVNLQIISRSGTIEMEAWLNSIFYLPEGTIYILDSSDAQNFLYLKGEGYATNYWHTKVEESPQYLNSIVNEVFGGFIVFIPETLSDEDNLKIIRKWVDYYRIAGTNYKIQTYE